jgi:hypothetical protein
VSDEGRKCGVVICTVLDQMRFWGTLEYGGETLIICLSTRSAIMIKYFSVQYNTVHLIASFRESPRATPVQSIPYCIPSESV